MTSGNLSDCKVAIPLLKKVSQLSYNQFTIGFPDATYNYEPIYQQLHTYKMRVGITIELDYN